jgi:hypothetical protein
MPFALLIVGVFLLVASIRDSQDTLFALLKSDFTGQNNFFYWFIAILVIGAVGYIKPLKPLSNAFLVLVVLVLFLKKGNPITAGGGFFKQFNTAIGSTQTASAEPTLGQAMTTDPTLASMVNQLRTITPEPGSLDN